MSTRSVLLAALVLAVAGTACQPPAQEVAGLSEEDAAAIESTVASFVQSALANNFAQWPALHTEDAVCLPPNQPAVKGRAAIQSWGEAFSLTDLTITLLEIDGRDGLAYGRSTYSYSGVVAVEGTAVPVTDSGKGMVVLRKQADGSWLIAVNIWNSDLPLPEQAPKRME
jgi:ketosteroid isomerase-like protein